jgi:prepilin-type N-terminal cleavage/methylation domain-containing protein
MKQLKGFSLLEILITMAMVSVLGAIVLPKYQIHLVQSKVTSAYVSLQAVTSYVDMYLIQNNEIKKTTPISKLGIRQLDAQSIGTLKLIKASNTEGIYSFEVNLSPSQVQGKVITMTKTNDQWNCETNLPLEFRVPDCKRLKPA